MNNNNLFYGFLEGATTLSMPIGYLYMGCSWKSTLFWVYIIHFLASFFYHVFPCKWTLYLDLSMINLMIMERGYFITKSVWVYIFYIISIIAEPFPRQAILMVRVFVIVCLEQRHTPTFIYLWSVFIWILVAFFYLYSCHLYKQGNALMSTLTCMVYHFLLGVVSALEVYAYSDEITNTTHGFLRYIIYFIFLFYTITHFTKDPKRLNSVMSFTTALVLSPLSIHQIYKQIQYGRHDTFQDDAHIQYFMQTLYMAYVASDFAVGWFYYPGYFTFLEGWAHHIGTFSFISYYYFIKPEKLILICMNQIIEVSSILLVASRIFYDVDWIQHIKKKYFFHIFLLCRVILPTLLFIYFYQLFDFFGCIVYVSMTSLHMYWLFKIYLHRSAF